MTEEVTEVKYIHSNFFPGDSSCTRIFDTINEKTAIPFDKSIEVLDLTDDENMTLKTF